MLRLKEIDEDPDQPRKEFSAEAMAEMVASIKARGVKSPISVRTHPKKKGRWMLNYGARRYRGSIEAGKTEIPAFVDEEHDDYDQVIENDQRENLTPMERALFIKRKISEGETASKIAKNLGKPAIMITEHMALIDMPACIEVVYTSGKSQSPKTIYELRKLHDKHPEQVEAWCAEAKEVTRRTVSELAETLSGKKKPAATKAEESHVSPAAGPGLDLVPAGVDAADDNGSPAGESGANGESGGNSVAAAERLPRYDPDEKERNETAISDPTKIKKPVLVVEFDSRSAMVMLNRRPTTPGLIHIKYEDGGEEIEVDAGHCRINCLIESRV